jgi:type VI secretion system protein ImpA
MINVEELLKPVADDKPSGDDFTYHESLLDLERVAKGKPADQFSEGEEADWKEVREKAMDVLRQSKHLRASVLLTLSLMKLGATEGLRDGLAVVRGITENFWPNLYPKLDPDDNNDPTERLNTLNDLSSPQFAFHVNQIVLCQSAALGRVTLGQYLSAKEADKAPSGDAPRPKLSGPDLNQINAIFRDTNPDVLKASLAYINESLDHASSIDKFIDEKLGSGNGVNFESFKTLLGKMKEAVEPHLAGEALAEGGASSADASGGGDSQSAARSQSGFSGTIQTRAQVAQALGLICDYYARHEPSSPVPLLLQRAQSLVDKDFMTILKDLNPDALERIQVITGKQEDK